MEKPFTMDVVLVRGKYTINSGEISKVSGYFSYEGRPGIGELPCLVADREKTTKIERGMSAPYIQSCSNHPAIWELFLEKKPSSAL